MKTDKNLRSDAAKWKDLTTVLFRWRRELKIYSATSENSDVAHNKLSLVLDLKKKSTVSDRDFKVFSLLWR